VLFLLFLYFPLTAVISSGYYMANGASPSVSTESPKAVINQLTNSSYDNALLGSPGQNSWLGEPTGIGRDVVAWQGISANAPGSIGYSYVDQKSGELKAGTWSPSAAAASPWFSNGYLFADSSDASGSSVISYDPSSGQTSTLPLYPTGGDVDYGSPVNNGTFFSSIASVTETLSDSFTQNVQEIDTATMGSGSWTTVVPPDYQEESGSCNNGYSSYDFFFQPSIPSYVFVGDQGSFAWVRENYRLSSDASGCPLAVPVSVDIVLNAGTTVASYPVEYNYTSGSSSGGAAIVGFWGHIILFSGTENEATTYKVYDTSTGTTSPTLPPGQDFCGPDAGCIFPYYYTDFKSDGNSLIWASLNSTGNGAAIYIWNSRIGLKSLTGTLSYRGLTDMVVGVSGAWAMWSNETIVGQGTVGYLNFYNFQDQSRVSVSVSGFTSDIDTDSGGNFVLFDFEAGRMVWVTGEYADQPGYSVLHVYDLNRLEAGLNPYNDVNLGFISGSISGPVLITPDEVFFTAVPSGESSASGNLGPLQVFAIKPPTLVPVVIIPDFARTRLNVGKNQTWPGASPPPYLTSKQKKAQAVTDFTLCGGPCGDRFKLFLNQSLPLYTPSNFSKSVKVGSIFDYKTVPLQHTPITPNGAPAVNVVINKTLSKLTNTYAGLESALTSVGYQMGVNMFTMPYDWRFDDSFQYAELGALIQIAQNDTGAYQVILIGHGNGGLIAEGYASTEAPGRYWINSIITIGTPFAGDPKAYYALLSGYGFGNPTADTAAMKILLQDYVSIYEQLPTQSFVISAGNTTKLPKLVTFNDLANWCAASANACLSPSQTYTMSFQGFNETVMKGKTALATVPLSQGENPEIVMKNYTGATSYTLTSTKQNTWSLNGTDIASADAFLSSFTGSNQIAVPTYAIVGAGVQTLSAFIMRQANSTEVKKGQYLEYYSPYDGTTSKVVLVPYFSNGDGTVPLWSQVDTDPNVTSLYFYTSSNHDKMVSDKGVDAMIQSILNGGRTEEDLCGGTPPNCKFDAHHISKNSEKANFVLHSDAELIVNDTGDASTFGLNMFGGIDENTTRGSYENMQGVEYVTVNNATSPLQVSLNGTQTGAFTLDTTLEGANNASFAYQNVPVANGSLALASFNPLQVTGSAAPQLTTSGAAQPGGTTTSTGSSQGGSAVPEFPGGIMVAVSVILIIVLAVAGVLLGSRTKNRTPKGS
jgi:hypothetical protein